MAKKAQLVGAPFGVLPKKDADCEMDACMATHLLNALPHPLLSIGGDGRIHDANPAAELFFAMSRKALSKVNFQDLLPFGSPLLGAIEQVRVRRAPINEYRVDLGTPRIGVERFVDIHMAPLPQLDNGVVVMLQERTIADKMDRQLTHRGAARSLSAMGAMLAHEIKNPLSGIRGAAQLLDTRRRRRGPRAVPADLRRDRPHRQPGRPHGGLFRRASGGAALHQHPRGAGSCAQVAQAGFARHIRFVEAYDPSLPPLLANRDKLDPGVSQPGEERRGSHRDGRAATAKSS